MTATITSLFKDTTQAPEFVAVILAATVGTRLVPLTSTPSSPHDVTTTTTTEANTSSGGTPKHLLPLAGVPNLIRLIRCLQGSGFVHIVLVISEEDSVTIPVLENEWKQKVFSHHDSNSNNNNSNSSKIQQLDLDQPRCHIFISRVDSVACSGSAEALRRILLQQQQDPQCQIIPLNSNLVILPGDLVILNSVVLEKLVHTHRTRSAVTTTAAASMASSSKKNRIPAACTILLGDVGEVDEHGSPLKESAKAKKGGLGREEEEIEYIALAYDDDDHDDESSSAPRVVWKQCKVDVEEDKEMVGASLKFVIPKPRLKAAGTTRVCLDWNDWHVYVLSPWVKQLILQRSSLISLQGDLIPLLVSRQFRGRRETFGSTTTSSYADPTIEAVVHQQPNESPSVKPAKAAPSSRYTNDDDDSSEYAVLAHVDTTKAVLRAHAVYSYLHATKVFVHQAAASTSNSTTSSTATTSLWFPPDASLHAKFSTLLLTPTDVKNFKSAVVGRHCTLGAKVRLNNVILMDHATIGDNVILQNTIVGTGCVIGENCNLNECQVGPGIVVPPGTKEKGESFE